MHKQVIVLRKDLNMRKGKMIAQGAHASLGAVLAWAREHVPQTPDAISIPLDEHIGPWLSDSYRKICVSVNSEEDLLAVFAKAAEADIPRCLIRDQGHTEFHGVPTHTAVVVGPAEASLIDAITGDLPLL